MDSQKILQSSERLAEGEKEYQQSQDPVWLSFMRKESSLLLRRVVKFWVKIRLQH